VELANTFLNQCRIEFNKPVSPQCCYKPKVPLLSVNKKYKRIPGRNVKETRDVENREGRDVLR
jgi:hypothetical protein